MSFKKHTSLLILRDLTLTKLLNTCDLLISHFYRKGVNHNLHQTSHEFKIPLDLVNIISLYHLYVVKFDKYPNDNSINVLHNKNCERINFNFKFGLKPAILQCTKPVQNGHGYAAKITQIDEHYELVFGLKTNNNEFVYAVYCVYETGDFDNITFYNNYLFDISYTGPFYDLKQNDIINIQIKNNCLEFKLNKKLLNEIKLDNLDQKEHFFFIELGGSNVSLIVK